MKNLKIRIVWINSIVYWGNVRIILKCGTLWWWRCNRVGILKGYSAAHFLVRIDCHCLFSTILLVVGGLGNDGFGCTVCTGLQHALSGSYGSKKCKNLRTLVV